MFKILNLIKFDFQNRLKILIFAKLNLTKSGRAASIFEKGKIPKFWKRELRREIILSRRLQDCRLFV